MKKLLRAGLAMARALAADAAVVCTQPPAGGRLPSFWWTPNGGGYDQHAWDNFSVACNLPVTEVPWPGGNKLSRLYHPRSAWLKLQECHRQ